MGLEGTGLTGGFTDGGGTGFTGVTGGNVGLEGTGLTGGFTGVWGAGVTGVTCGGAGSEGSVTVEFTGG